MAKPKFDPYAGMSQATKDELRKTPHLRGSKRVAAHTVKNGQIFREGRTDPVPIERAQVLRDRHLRRAQEIQESIDRMNADRLRHLEQAQTLADAITEAGS